MFSKITFAAALALVVSGLAGTAHAYDAFGDSDHEMVIRQSAKSPAVHSLSKADDRFTVGSNAWTGDRDGLITAGALTGLGKNVVATNAR
jgi:hypothetical protein